MGDLGSPLKMFQGAIYGLFADDPVSGELAASHIEPSGLGHQNLVRARDVGRGIRFYGSARRDEWPQSGPGTADICGTEARSGEVAVDDFQQVVTISGRAANLVWISREVSVGGADDRSLAPGDCEQDTVSFRHDQCRSNGQSIGGHHQMHALGEAQFDRTVAEFCRPRAGRIDDGSGNRCGLAVALATAVPNLPMSRRGHGGGCVGAHHLAVVVNCGASDDGTAQGIKDEACVLGEAVEVADASVETFRRQSRSCLQHLGTVQGLRFPKILTAAEQIVNFDTDCEFPPGPVAAAVAWKQEWERLGEVGSDLAERHLLRAGLPHQADTPLSKIAQAPVQQPARAAAGAGCEVTLLVKDHFQPTQCGLPCNSRTDDAAADHQYVTWSIRGRRDE